MTQANERDSWDELFLISIIEKGGAVFQFNAFITNYDIQRGEKSFETAANGAGGRVKMHKPETDTEIILEGYFTQVGNDEGSAGLINADGAVQPLSIANDHTRKLYALAIMHTTNESQTDAMAVTVDGDRAERDVFKNGEFISAPQSFTDSSRKTTLRFKVPPFSKDGTSNITEESTDGSTAKILPAVTYP